MNLPMPAMASGYRVTSISGLTILLLFATHLPAQTTSVTDSSPPRSWLFAVNPELRQLAGDLAGTHIWSVGLAASIERSLTSQLSIEGVVHAASAPQLNFKDTPQMNVSGLSAGLLWLTPRKGNWSPFLRGGLEASRFKMDEPAVGANASAQYLSYFGGGGVRYAITPSVHFSTDVVVRASSYGQAMGFRTGLVLPFRVHRAVAPKYQPPVVVHDTVRMYVTDTVAQVTVRTDTVLVTDTVVVRETTEKKVTVKGDETILTLKDASFDFSKPNLRPEVIPMLDALATELTAPSNSYRIRIVGHTDGIGSAENNHALGLARATSVRAYLATRGVASDRIDVDSGGETFPIATNSTEAGRQLNRRVVVTRSR